MPPSFVSIPPTPVKGYILKLSDQFSTSVNFYSASGSRGDIYLQSNLSECVSQECVMILKTRTLKVAVDLGAGKENVMDQ